MLLPQLPSYEHRRTTVMWNGINPTVMEMTVLRPWPQPPWFIDWPLRVVAYLTITPIVRLWYQVDSMVHEWRTNRRKRG